MCDGERMSVEITAFMVEEQFSIVWWSKSMSHGKEDATAVWDMAEFDFGESN